MTSKTPITDKAAFPVIDADTDECTHAVPVRTSEQLETELAEAKKQAFAYKTALEQAEAELTEARAEIENKQYSIVCASEEIHMLRQAVAEARAEVERLEIRLLEQQERAAGGHTATAAAVKLECYKRINAKNELIKQMWEAIKNALQSADAEWENKNQGHDWAEACETMRVALEAAERSE